ncbi:hypothetical protein RRG08_059819 [Elysia crispata]|uniref:Uncharacterized protein n=1 Tax=Elysia crispata TaxID=231223 RepID=A0AAE1EDW6_9GAST|nr:hypothetical protein RRG08_059819 [Elysia crispata]
MRIERALIGVIKQEWINLGPKAFRACLSKDRFEANTEQRAGDIASAERGLMDATRISRTEKWPAETKRILIISSVMDKIWQLIINIARQIIRSGKVLSRGVDPAKHCLPLNQTCVNLKWRAKTTCVHKRGEEIQTSLALASCSLGKPQPGANHFRQEEQQ